MERALQADIDAARSPSAAARALDHRLGGPAGQRRYTAPSFEIADPERGLTAAVPGFNPIEASETAIANLAPELTRRPPPETVEELLAWPGSRSRPRRSPRSRRLEPAKARVALSRVARPLAAGAGFYWTLD